MVLVGNNCLVGHIYRDVLNQEHQSPFIWTRIWNDDMEYLLRNFENIHFENVEVGKHSPLLSGKNDFYLKIDDKVIVNFQHYIFSKDNNNKPFINGRDIYYNRPWLLILETYNKRLKRMQSANEKPIIIIEDMSNYKTLIDICKQKKYRLLMFTNHLQPCTSNELLILPHNYGCNEPANYSKHYEKQIKEFLSK